MTDSAKQLDLGLLRCLDALVAESHVSRAAERLGMGQPAMSRVLGRLRELFGDPILIRGATGMLPSPRAVELAAIARRILADVDLVLGEAIRFEPALCTSTFRIIATDYTHATFLPLLTRSVREEAPSATLSIKHPVHPKALALALEEGDIELAIGHLEEPPVSLRSVPLFVDHIVCLIRAGHPYLDGSRSIEDFVALPHILVTPAGFGHFQSNIDHMLADTGLKRNVGMLSQHFMAAPYIVQSTDMAVLMPRRLAQHYVGGTGLTMIDPPLQIPTYRIFMYWHERSHRDPSLRWLRELARRCALELPPP
jgi:DNA-binding transcriptional LysR family regulator